MERTERIRNFFGVPKWIPSTSSSSLWNENGNETRERHYPHMSSIGKNCFFVCFVFFSVPRLGHQSRRVSPRWNLRSVHGPLNSSELMAMPNCTDLHSCSVGSREYAAGTWLSPSFPNWKSISGTFKNYTGENSSYRLSPFLSRKDKFVVYIIFICTVIKSVKIYYFYFITF